MCNNVTLEYKEKIYDTPALAENPLGKQHPIFICYTYRDIEYLIERELQRFIAGHIRVCISCTNIFRNQKLETITRTPRGIRISATFSHRSRVSYISCTVCVCVAPA